MLLGWSHASRGIHGCILSTSIECTCTNKQSSVQQDLLCLIGEFEEAEITIEIRPFDEPCDPFQDSDDEGCEDSEGSGDENTEENKAGLQGAVSESEVSNCL